MASKAISLTNKWRALKIFIPLVWERVHPEESKHSKQMNLLAYNHPMKSQTVALANNHKALLIHSLTPLFMNAQPHSWVKQKDASAFYSYSQCLWQPRCRGAGLVGKGGGQNGAFGHCNSHNHSLPSQLLRASGMPERNLQTVWWEVEFLASKPTFSALRKSVKGILLK